MDLHDEFENFAFDRATESGNRLRGAEVRARLDARVTRGRRARYAAAGAGTVAAVGLIAVGAVMVPRLGTTPVAPPSSAGPVVFSTGLPTTTIYGGGDVPDFYTVFGLHGPQDGIVGADPLTISQEIPAQFACGAEWTLEPGHYLNQTIDRSAEFGDGVFPSQAALDVAASDINFVSQVDTDLGNYYDTFVLAWVKDGVIVGNARVSREYGPLIEGASGERVSTVRGAEAAGADAVRLPLTGPGSCEVGAAPQGLADGSYELHVVHEYSGAANVRVDGRQYDDPSEQVERPTDGQLVEFISGDPYGAVVDPAGGPWVIDVVGLDG